MKKLALFVGCLFLAACGGANAEPQSAAEIIGEMVELGMGCTEVGEFPYESDSPLPQTWETAQYCRLESVDTRLKVFTFGSERDADMVYTYFDAFDGLFGSYLARDGLTVMQVSVDVPKPEADELIGYYEEAAK